MRSALPDQRCAVREVLGREIASVEQFAQRSLAGSLGVFDGIERESGNSDCASGRQRAFELRAVAHLVAVARGTIAQNVENRSRQTVVAGVHSRSFDT